MQKRPKMTPSRSSAVNSPVIADSACLRLAQLLGEELDGRRGGGDVRRGGGQVPGRRTQRVDVARAREVGVLGRGIGADHRQHLALQRRQAVPGQRGQVHVAPRGAALLARRGVRRDAGEVGLVVHDDQRQARRQPRQERRVLRRQRGGRLARIDQHDDQVGALHRGPGALDADALDGVGRIAQSGGVDHRERDAGNLDHPRRPDRGWCPRPA